MRWVIEHGLAALGLALLVGIFELLQWLFSANP
jgi:hypothetical protein